MEFELQACTAPGQRMVELAEEHAADFATRAAEHDLENTFVAENFDLMKESGLLAAAAPKEFGGLGVESAHDITVAISRLARGCGSTAIRRQHAHRCGMGRDAQLAAGHRQWRQRGVGGSRP